MHPTNYKNPDQSSILHVYFQILCITKQFNDVNIFCKMSNESLNVKLNFKNNFMRKGNDAPLKELFLVKSMCIPK